MKGQVIQIASLLLVVAGAIQSCTSNQPPQSQTSPQATPAETTAAEPGTLQIRANGEDFVRQGFTSKDGWKISFENVYATLGDVTAYQTDPPYDAEADKDLNAKEKVSIDAAKTVDLAAGGNDAEPILVGEIKAPPGRYNALSWRLVKATEGPANGAPLLLKGQATKNGQTVDFNLKLDQELAYTCGEFVGDDRKGELQPGGTADLEATFHFDHLFGDADAPAEDELNKGALGFQPLATIAQGGKLNVDMATLKQELTEQDYKKLLAILPSLGHVGEGHCKETQLAAS
jgi:hypothetical protein